MACTHQRTRTGLVLESFHTGGQLSDLILEALRVAEEINKYLSLPPHLVGTIFKDLRIILHLISLLKNMVTKGRGLFFNYFLLSSLHDDDDD